MDNIAKRLRWARERAGMTQEQLAMKADVTKDIIAQIEAGRSERPRRFLEIARALNVSPGWLAFGETEYETLTERDLARAKAIADLPEHLREAVDSIINADKS